MINELYVNNKLTLKGSELAVKEELLKIISKHTLNSDWRVWHNRIYVDIKKIKLGDTPMFDRSRGC